MGESFQEYSWIQDFEADFPKNAELGRLLKVLWFILVCLKRIGHINIKIWMGILQVLRSEFRKFGILEISNFHPCR